MRGNDSNDPEIAQWDPGVTRQVRNAVAPVIKRWFRPEVRGLDRLPQGGALVVANHSGGMFTPDVLVFASAFYETFGYERPLYTLAHYGVFVGPIAGWLRRLGGIHANPDNAAKALHAGAVVLVFPGGDYDAYRPTLAENIIDFNGRTGYIKAAVKTGVPIVPMVSIGGQETQLFLNRGDSIAKRIGLTRLRIAILPISFGVPFGFSMFLPPNLPLPSKIVTQVLDPIDVIAKFGETPDIQQVDCYVRTVMQAALDRLARQRRIPVLG